MGVDPVVWIGALLCTGAVGLLWYAVSLDRTTSMKDRLSVPASTDLRDIVLARSAQERVVQPGLGRLASFGRALTPAGLIDRLDRKIMLAGVGREWPLERVLGMKFILGAGAGLYFFLQWANNPGDTQALAIAIAGTIGAFILPDLLIGIQGQKRQDEIALALPDVLDQITIAVEAGLGFEAAMGHVSREIDSPISEEFARTLQDIRVGMSRRQAFNQMTERTDVPQLRHFVSSLQQAERLGVPIAQVLRMQAAELRVIRRQNAEENAQKMPVKMLIPLVLFILPALVIVVLAPAVFDAYDTFSGGI